MHLVIQIYRARWGLDHLLRKVRFQSLRRVAMWQSNITPQGGGNHVVVRVASEAV